jgi:alpha-tubulin suppressor-like RCC1 family protein
MTDGTLRSHVRFVVRVSATTLGTISLLGLYCGSATASQRVASTATEAWGNGVSESPEAVGGVPQDVSAVQAANWGGLAIAGENNQVWQWSNSSPPKASEVGTLEHVVSVGEGFDFGAAVTSEGALWTWGDNSKTGDLCLGSTSPKSYSPRQVPGISNAVAVSGGGDHLLILLGNGKVMGCGSNLFGQLGDGNTKSSSSPVAVKTLDDIVAISSGSNSSVALGSSGKVWTWGLNNLGQLGDGNTHNSDTPVHVSLPGPVDEIFAGGWSVSTGHDLALLDNGSVYAWGNDSDGQLGNDRKNPYSDTPVKVLFPSGVAIEAVAAGGCSSYALDTSGNIWAWGNNGKGELGDGHKSADVLEPRKVASGFTKISAVARQASAIADTT